MELFKTRTNIDFLAQTRRAFVLSAVLIAASVYIWVKRGSEKYGIDFMGGHEILVEVQEKTDAVTLRRALEQGGLKDVTVQSFEAGSQDYSIRMGLKKDMDAQAIKERVQQVLRELYDARAKIIASDSVGATIGDEVKRRALWAISLGLLGVLIYIAVRFEFSYALGAVMAMFHDVIVGAGVYLFVGHDINGAALAAALTIMGYSVNDTIVIFDRVREEYRKRPKTPLADLMNESMNACLSRTIITSLLTLFAAAALLIFGGGAIQDLSLFLVAGMVSGVYSTVYIASPVVLWWEGIRNRRKKK